MWTYSGGGQPEWLTNTPFTPNTTLSLANGLYTLQVYVDDITGNVNSSSVGFGVNVTSADTTAPLLYVISPSTTAR